MTTVTCAEASELLDAFVDAELPAPMLLAVARHAGGCAACDEALRQRSALHDAVERVAREDAEELDLSGVWPGVSARIERDEVARMRIRRLRQVPAWAAVAAIAAGAVFWLRTPLPTTVPPQVATVSNVSNVSRVVARPRANRAVIERIDSDAARVQLRSERRDGTTLIMVSDDSGGATP